MPAHIASMTGFARTDGAFGDTRWTYEVKSVNGRGLDARLRLPPGMEELDAELRKALKDAFARGNFSVNLSLETASAAAGVRINRVVLDAYLKEAEALRSRMDCAPSTPEGLLSLRGVIEAGDDALSGDDAAPLRAALVKGFAQALSALGEARRKEGVALAELIADGLATIESLTGEAEALETTRPEAIRDRLRDQLAELLSGAGVPDERLAQEAALLALKADVREELDRLNAHVKAGRDLLAKGGAVGRQLDFLTQEFNREANTLCSKAADMALKRIGLDLKQAIDQMREQVQNIE